MLKTFFLYFSSFDFQPLTNCFSNKISIELLFILVIFKDVNRVIKGGERQGRRVKISLLRTFNLISSDNRGRGTEADL